VVGRFGLDETPVLAAVWMLRSREESEERLFHSFCRKVTDISG
jgi:hypothetical protein